MGILQAHAAISLALAAVLWTVQLVIYPAFAHIDSARFCKWHYSYTGAITWVVAPLILLQAGGVAARLWILGRPDLLWLLEAGSTLCALTMTAFVSVPIHNSLQREPSADAIRRLVLTNWPRTVAWSTCAVCSWLAVPPP